MATNTVPGLAMGTLLCLVMCSTAQAEEPIATDRPDFVESSDTVGRGRFQIETSIAFERDRRVDFSSRVRSTPTLLRYGFNEDWELRLESDGAIRQRLTESGIGTRQSGTADLAVGAKWHWRDGDEASGAPGLAWLVHVDLDSGSAAYRGQGLRPSLRLVAEWELAGGWSAGLMPGIYRDRNENGKHFTGAILAAVLGKSLTEQLRGFVELSGQQLTSDKNGGKLVTFDTGLAYLLTNTLQLDLALARGLNKNSPDLAWTFGLSVKY